MVFVSNMFGILQWESRRPEKLPVYCRQVLGCENEIAVYNVTHDK